MKGAFERKLSKVYTLESFTRKFFCKQWQTTAVVYKQIALHHSEHFVSESCFRRIETVLYCESCFRKPETSERRRVTLESSLSKVFSLVTFERKLYNACARVLALENRHKSNATFPEMFIEFRDNM